MKAGWLEALERRRSKLKQSWRLAGFAFPQENERALVLPEQHGVGGKPVEFDGLADEQRLPVEAVHQRMGLGHDAALEVGSGAGAVLDEDDGIPRRQHRIERVVGGDG